MDIELKVNRRITTAFIATQPVPIVLIPRLKTKQPTGGTTWVKQPARAAQTLRLVEPPSSGPPTRTADGINRVVEFMIMGEYDASIGVYDIFDHDGGTWEVVYLYHFNGWERRAEVARHG